MESRAIAETVSLRPRLDFLDGLRALAALWVVASHLWISQFGMFAHDGWVGWATNWMLYSHLAVDLFIVLSGFCLVLPVARDGGLRGGMWAFYARRARRILPPFYAALALSLLLTFVFQAMDHQPFQLNVPAALANVFLLQDLSRDWNIFNGPFWSIAVEWRIYFLFPVLVWVLRRGGRRAMLVLSVVVGGALTWAVLGMRPQMLLACPWYLALFALGLCAGSLVVPRKLSVPPPLSAVGGLFWASLFALTALLRAYPVTTHDYTNFGRHMPLVDAAMGLCAAAYLVTVHRAVLGSKKSILVSLLAARPLVALGGFAYSLYLIHMPLILLFSRLFAPLLPAPKLLALAVIGLPAILILAYLFFLAFERPFLKPRASSLPVKKPLPILAQQG